jgi:hypothetical protein
MTTQSTVSRFDQRSLLGIGVSVGAAVAVERLCKSLGVSDPLTGTLTAGAASLPAAAAYSLQGRRRNVTDEIWRLRQGELRRPITPVVVMLTAALFVAEVIANDVVKRKLGQPYSIIEAIGPRLSFWYEIDYIFIGLIAGALAFFISWYASHYLGKHPYRWTVVAVGVVFILIEAVGVANRDYYPTWRNYHFLSDAFAYNLMVLNASVAGAWCGRRRHDKFLAKKLARLERKAAKQAAKRPEPTLQSQATGMQASAEDSSAPQDLVPIATQPNGAPPSLPQNLPTRDPFEQIDKLLHLRDKGALTEEEFQAKKSEILGRI